MTGNDDLGTMSAWYVFSSLGLYPTMSGANFLAVSSPQFASATVHIGRFGDRQGGTLTITAPGASDTNRYVQRVSLDGRGLTRTWLDWPAVAHGGTLAHALGAAPSAWGTDPAAEPPSVNHSPGERRSHVDASVRPGTAVVPAGDPAQPVQLDLDVLGQSPGELVALVTASTPAGWTARVGDGPLVVLRSDGLPVQRSTTVTLSVPRHTAIGSYPVRITVTALGANTVSRDVRVEVRTPATCAVVTNGQCAVDLARDRNKDGIATVEQPAQGNFDDGGWSYDAALLPTAGPVTWDGVIYAAPDPTGTAANFVQARGQSLLLP
jgi:hypothetical protein